MSIRSQAAVLIIFILISVALSRVKLTPLAINNSGSAIVSNASVTQTPPSNLAYERASLLGNAVETVPPGPVRNWNVLDPPVTAQAVLIQSLDDYYPFFNYNTYTQWPIASLTKILTAVIVLEDVGLNKKIPISAAAVATEGNAGGLKSGEVYTAQDLLKIMLMVSSNNAAAAFAEYLGNDQFVKLMNDKAQEIGMNQTIVYDSNGLNDSNLSSASDLMRLTRYVLQNHPEIFTWTRLTNFTVQPINDVRTQNLKNIDQLTERPDFLGGKTGTSQQAKENLLAIFNHDHYRLAVIILGSNNRYADIDALLNWLDKAYTF